MAKQLSEKIITLSLGKIVKAAFLSSDESSSHIHFAVVMDKTKLEITEESNFVFHISAGTGEVVAAYYTPAIDGVKNIWIDKIGVNIEPAK